jgi:thiamine biosynthesis lipoprotein
MSCRTNITVIGGSDDLADRALDRLADLEQRWSRFIARSEISRLNEAHGEPVRVSPETIRLVSSLVQGWYATNGAFDPTLLAAMVELGYSSSRDDATLRTSLGPEVAPQGQPERILVDPTHGVVQLPRGTTLDPGGLGKGLAADIVCEELLAAGANGALVEVGGDLRAAGETPSAQGWTVSVAASFPDESPSVIGLQSGGIATSSSRIRTWQAGEETRHHLLNSQTLQPCRTSVVACTVIAGTGAWAEAFTKPAFALEIPDALEFFEQHGLAVCVTTDDRTQHVTPAWSEFAR